jgi:hypothetical protein
MLCGIQTPSAPKFSVPSSEPLSIGYDYDYDGDGDDDDGYNFPEMFRAKKIILSCSPFCSDIENSV